MIFISVDKPNVWAWLGDSGFSTQLGFVQHSTNGELLQQWALTPLSSGSYAMYLANADHDSDLSIADYRLDFFVQAIPEPGTIWLLVAGAGFAGLRGWRKAQRVRGAR